MGETEQYVVYRKDFHRIDASVRYLRLRPQYKITRVIVANGRLLAQIRDIHLKYNWIE